MPILSGGPLYRDKTKAIEDYPATLGQTAGAAFDRAVDTGLGDLALGAVQLATFNFSSGLQNVGRTFGIDAAAEMDPSKRVNAADARKRAEAQGVKLDVSDDAYFSPGELDTVIRLKKRERKQLQTLNRRPQTWGGFAAEIGGGLVGSLTDPFQVAASFIPVVGQARYAKWIAAARGPLGRAGVRAGVGAAEGFVGSAIIEPFVYTRAQSLGLEYDSTDSFMNLTFGTVLGGGLHVAGGFFGDAITGRYDPPEQTSRAALADAVTALEDGRSFNVAPLFDEHAARSAVGEIGRLRRQLDVVAREEDTALEASFRADRSGVKATASDKIAALQDEISGLERDIASARERAATSIDDVTPTRIAAISRELSGDISAKRRADLEAEQRLLTEGAPITRAEEELAKGRAEAEAVALEKAKARAEKALKAEQDRLGKAAATETKGDAALAAAGKRTTSRRGDVERLTARAVRRWAATVGERIDDAQAAEIAARLLASPLDGFEATARAELSALASPDNLRGMEVKPDSYDPKTGYEPPDMQTVRAEAEKAVRSGDADTVDAEIEALNEMLVMAEKREPLNEFDRAALELADAFETKSRISADSYRAAASCLSGLA